MFRKKSNCSSIYGIRFQKSHYCFGHHILQQKCQPPVLVRKLPNVNSSVVKPEAERAVTRAEGPGMGITGIFSFTHNFACNKISNVCISIFKINEK
jgi:hypothetical protein